VKHGECVAAVLNRDLHTIALCYEPAGSWNLAKKYMPLFVFSAVSAVHSFSLAAAMPCCENLLSYSTRALIMRAELYGNHAGGNGIFAKRQSVPWDI